jgi:hypothetical protein
MTENARLLLARMLKETGLSQHGFARLTGQSEKSVQVHAKHGVIPMTKAEWYHQIQEIRTQPGYATITVGMPSTTPVGEYRRHRTKT